MRKPFNLKAVLPLSERVTFYSLKTKEKKISKTEKSLVAFGKNQTGHVFYILTFQL